MNLVKKNEAGVTLTELMIAMAISGITMLALSQLVVYINRSIKTSTDSLENTSAEILVYKVLSNDLQNAFPSYNNFEGVTDDLVNREFFDFYNDTGCHTDCERKITLSATSKNKEIMFLLEDNSASQISLYMPSWAFQITPYDVQNDKDGTKTFVGLNNGKHVDKLKGDGLSIWRDKSLVMLQSPVELRPYKSGTKFPDMSAPGRRLFIVGSVNGDTFEYNKFEQPTGAKLRSTHPTDPSITVDRLDGTGSARGFFDILPPIGGEATFTLIQNVKLVKYSLEQSGYYTDIQTQKSRPTNRLMRSEWVRGKGFTTSSTIGTNIQRVEFYRENTSMAVVEFTIGIEGRTTASSNPGGG